MSIEAGYKGGRVIILSSRWADEGRVESDRLRFGDLAALLSSLGLPAVHRTFASERELRQLLESERPPLAFSAAHRSSPDGTGANVHAVFENLRIPYVGSSPETIDLALSKPRLKDLWKKRGILTPDHFVIRRDSGGGLSGMEALCSATNYPYFVKPASEGNSRGIGYDSVVHNAAELEAKASAVAEEFGEALVEVFVGGGGAKEFTVAVVGNGSTALVMPARISFLSAARSGAITVEDKDGHRTCALPIGDAVLSARIEELARVAFCAAGVRDYARGDFILCRDRLYAIEINGQPMMPDRWFAACCAGRGMDARTYPAAVFLAGMTRLESKGLLLAPIPDAMRDLVQRGSETRIA